MKTRHSFTSFLSLSAFALFAAVLPAARAGEPAAPPAAHTTCVQCRHQKRHLAYTAEPIRIIAEPMPAQDQPLNPADYRSFQENNLINPG